MVVRDTFIYTKGKSLPFQDCQLPINIDDVEIVVLRRFLGNKTLRLPSQVKSAILYFLRNYHKEAIASFDCYAFVNLINDHEVHSVRHMLAFWEIYKKPPLPHVGAILFYCSNDGEFHHAAVYIGSGLYISVYGAGGHLEVSTHKDMMRDFKATSVYLACPRKNNKKGVA